MTRHQHIARLSRMGLDPVSALGVVAAMDEVMAMFRAGLSPCNAAMCIKAIVEEARRPKPISVDEAMLAIRILDRGRLQ